MGLTPPQPLLVPKVLEKSRAIPLLTQMGCVAYKKVKTFHIHSYKAVMGKLRPAGQIRPPEMFYPARATLFLI